ncbi:hypothetical protein ACQP00_30445 [Dactylosporangium sp. CS-047395]|uniref:hypothetical protein n=1 Tax=Dactylosporangium sp. CS-047395 TaxID=3239936 RepID=UPI003D8F21FF
MTLPNDDRDIAGSGVPADEQLPRTDDIDVDLGRQVREPGATDPDGEPVDPPD